MKKTLTKAGVFALLSAFMIGSVPVLNYAISNAQAVEDSRIITAPAIKETSETDLVNENAASSTSVEAKTNSVQELNIEISVEESDPDNQPSEKDLSAEDAAYIMAEALKEYLDVDVDGGKFTMFFTSNGVTAFGAGNWHGNFINAQNEIHYWCAIDSVTGQLYKMTRYNAIITEDSHSYFIADEEEMEARLLSEDYIDAARSYISEKFPEKEISRVNNRYNGSIGGAASIDEDDNINDSDSDELILEKETMSAICATIAESLECDIDKISMTQTNFDYRELSYATDVVLTEVEFTDGTGYMVTMGAVTKDIYGLDYYPDISQMD